jgi:DNA-binding response OmpR family regulator
MTSAFGDGAPGGAEARHTILLAEDEEAVRAVVLSFLTHAGYHVLAAADGSEGVALANRHPGPIHLVLSDVVMPRLRGPEMVRELRRTHPRLPVLYLTGTSDGVPDSPGTVTACLPKPFTMQELLASVALLLRERPAG